jgi:hypothetical protein
VNRYRGYYRTWERKVAFGIEAPVPRLEYHETPAQSEQAARTLCELWAKRSGYALGGILFVLKVDPKPPKLRRK